MGHITRKFMKCRCQSICWLWPPAHVVGEFCDSESSMCHVSYAQKSCRINLQNGISQPSPGQFQHGVARWEPLDEPGTMGRSVLEYLPLSLSTHMDSDRFPTDFLRVSYEFPTGFLRVSYTSFDNWASLPNSANVGMRRLVGKLVTSLTA